MKTACRSDLMCHVKYRHANWTETTVQPLLTIAGTSVALNLPYTIYAPIIAAIVYVNGVVNASGEHRVDDLQTIPIPNNYNRRLA